MQSHLCPSERRPLKVQVEYEASEQQVQRLSDTLKAERKDAQERSSAIALVGMRKESASRKEDRFGGALWLFY